MWTFQRKEAAARARAREQAAKRRARRKKKWSPRPYNPAYQKRIPVTQAQIEQLVALAQGKVSISEGAWFYSQFIRFSQGMAKTPEHVQKYLQQAHWLEEDDIRQQIHILRWILDQKSEVIRDEFWRLATALRIHLIKDERVFRVDVSHIEVMYQYDIEMAKQDDEPTIEPPNLDIVFEENKLFSTFDRYVLYLYHCMGKSEQEIANTLLLSRDSVMKIRRRLERQGKGTKEITDAQHENTGRYRSPTLAVFVGG